MTDPRTLGIGAGDLVDVIVRGRVCMAGPLTLVLTVPLDEAPGSDVPIPVAAIQSARLVGPDPDTEHVGTIRLIEDVIDATSDRMFASGGGRLTVTTDRTAPAILAALVERGWTPPNDGTCAGASWCTALHHVHGCHADPCATQPHTHAQEKTP